MKVYEMICDIDCYGYIKKHKRIMLSEKDYNMVKEKGYYLA